MNNRACDKSLILRAALWTAGAGAALWIAGGRAPMHRQLSEQSRTTTRPESGMQAGQPVRPRDFNRDPRRRGPAVSPEEWERAQAFLKQHSPNRLMQYMKLYPAAQERVQRVLMNRYRNLMRLQAAAPELYKTKVQEVELEDEVFGICLKIKAGDGDVTALQASLKPKLAALFDKGIEERQLRIAMLEKALAKQNLALAKEQKIRDQRIEQQFQRVASHGVEGATFGPVRLPHPSPESAPSGDVNSFSQ